LCFKVITSDVQRARWGFYKSDEARRKLRVDESFLVCAEAILRSERGICKCRVAHQQSYLREKKLILRSSQDGGGITTFAQLNRYSSGFVWAYDQSAKAWWAQRKPRSRVIDMPATGLGGNGELFIQGTFSDG
jgi:hypothetical protein